MTNQEIRELACGRYTIVEFSQLSGVPKSTLYSWKKRDILSPIKDLGGRPYYTEEQLQYVLSNGGAHRR